MDADIETEQQNHDDDLTQEQMVDLFVKTTGITFEMFKKNPSILRKSKEHMLEISDRGQSMFGNVKKQRYFLKLLDGRIYEAKSLEKLQYIADCEGVDLNSCALRPELREDTSTSITLEITYLDRGVRKNEQASSTAP